MRRLTGGIDPVVWLCKAHQLPRPEVEVRFHPTRKWRADYCWPDRRVIVEVDGGLYQRHPSHASIGGQRRDMEKANAAQLLGYRYFRVTPQEVTQDDTLLQILKAVLA